MEVYGLIGHPVGHSLSPQLHEAGFRERGIDARYVTFEPPKDAGASAVLAAETLGIGGLNVTIPFKEDVFDVVEPDPLAEQVGAINTIVFGDERPRGYNTDVAGAVRSFYHHDVDLAGARALVIGAGGAGRGIAFGLRQEGAIIQITNRTFSRAKRLAEEIDGATAHGLDALPALLEDADIVVNATSVGMDGGDSIVPPHILHEDLVVMDAVYRPLETPLLEAAAQAGATTIDGAWMLLFQGIEAFERWTGQEAPVNVMNSALRDALG